MLVGKKILPTVALVPMSTQKVLSEMKLSPAIPADLRCIAERQVFSDIHKRVAGVGKRCRHGCPQAFGWRLGCASGQKFQSALFRLSCPLLVQRLDEWESEGGIEEINKLVEETPTLHAAFNRTNAAHTRIRRTLLSSDDEKLYTKEFPPEVWKKCLSSGLAGLTPAPVADVKCLHAQLADFLCRQDNPIGAEIWRRLQAKGVPVNGSDTCIQQCDVTRPLKSASWAYFADKNRLGLRKRRATFPQLSRDGSPPPPQPQQQQKD
eukprot:c12189_g3_i4.p1 GENE.c12189_g3_i4~~c12189_g3_i4.p1  ORF type:complete len:264 (-),score=45.60 c12189_g3_i4:35-826(-)